ncbi:MAG TPA: IS110 family transposase [Streptosporangiaceae bacterium]|jgi:transposase|nr:IS110 family transposase [Streptosporangiaceae bacterium]HJY67213.1 IS110 family transposase [Streptosporangiaceae bacterium]
MAAVMIGVDPHKASHTAVAISAAEEPLGELRVRACVAQAERLLAWAAAWPQRTWAVEGAGGTGHLLAQQLVSAGERVLDVQPKLGARVRLLAAGDVNKNDPNDARSVAVAALRSAGVREVRADDHAAVLKIWSKRYRDLGRSRTQVVCRLHAVLGELIPGGVPKAITAARAARVLKAIRAEGAVQAARWELAAAFLEDLRRIDAGIRETRKKLAAAVAAAGTSLTGLFGVGPVIAAAVIGDVRDVSRFPGRDHFAAYNGTAPIEVSSGRRKVYRLSRRGNRRLNHAIHMAAITQIRHRRSQGRAYYDKKLAEGKTPKEALRALKRQVSNAIFACLQADARRAAARLGGPGGQQGNDSAASAAGSHPRHRLFGQATPGPGHHPTTVTGGPPPGPARSRGTAGHSSIAAKLPPATPQVQVERPQRSEDERPGGAARRRPHSAARKAAGQTAQVKTQRPKGTSQAAERTDGTS